MSGKKLTLDMAAMEDAFFADTALIGLASRLSAPRLCWLLNRRFDLQLGRRADLDICVTKAPSQQYYFPIYEYTVPLSDMRYLLYRLKCREECLLPELKQLDFLWMIQGGEAAVAADRLTIHLRRQQEIQLAQVLSADRLKNPGYLLV